MTSELAKWFDAMTTTCLNVNPRLLDGVNVGLAKTELERLSDKPPKKAYPKPPPQPPPDSRGTNPRHKPSKVIDKDD